MKEKSGPERLWLKGPSIEILLFFGWDPDFSVYNFILCGPPS